MMNHPPSPSRPCPECGGPRVAGLNCQEQLEQLFVWEWQDPELLAEHFLTVASYNLQHPSRFTTEAYVALQEVFLAYLREGLPIAEVRRRVSALVAGKKRVLKDPAEQHLVPRAWSRTIASVYKPSQPEGAAARVRAWATSISHDLAT